MTAEREDHCLRRVDVRSGYGHRGAEKLFEVRDYRSLIMLADRHDWWAAFSGELCVTLAVENAMRLPVPPRAAHLRTLLAEYARVHSHLSFLSYLTAGKLEASLWAVVEELRGGLRAWTGNRIHPMINRVGGLAADMPAGWDATVIPLLDRVDALSHHLDEALQDAAARLSGLATLTVADCLDYGLSGPVARGAGMDLDRRGSGYLAYRDVFVAAPVRSGADTHDRLALLIDEVRTQPPDDPTPLGRDPRYIRRGGGPAGASAQGTRRPACRGGGGAVGHRRLRPGVAGREHAVALGSAHAVVRQSERLGPCPRRSPGEPDRRCRIRYRLRHRRC